MKRLMVLLCLIALPVLAGSVNYTATFSKSDLAVSGSDPWEVRAAWGSDPETVVELRGCLPMVTAGQPRLPHVYQTLSIPSGAEPTSVEVTAEDWTTLPGSYQVAPAQPDAHLPVALRGQTPGKSGPHGGLTPKVYPPDPKTYGSNGWYPSYSIRLAQSGTMSGFRLANVEVCPVRWNPATGVLQLAKRLSYRVNYTAGGGGRGAGDEVLATARQRDHFAELVRHLVVNPAAVNGNAPRAGKSHALTFLPPGQFDWVAITQPPMDTVFQRLGHWKASRGVSDTVVTLDWITAHYSGYDNPEKMRNFITDAHTTWGTMYVLLGGQGDYNSTGQNIIPTRFGNCDGEDEPCDHYYECLDGTWDANGNHVYGEIADNPDLYADVHVGRAPVYNIAMAQNFVRKIISYESNPPAGFIKKASLVTAMGDTYAMQESIARMTQTIPGWTDQRLYEWTGHCSDAEVRDSTNLGLGIGSWEGHGNQNGIYLPGGTTPLFVNPDVDSLTNDLKGGVVLSIACDVGGWDMVPDGDCFAEHWLNNTHGGSIATIMNSRYGYGGVDPQGHVVPGPSERYDTTWCAAVIDWGLNHTGEASTFSKSAWAPYADSLYQYAETRYCMYDWNLLGDPETPIWTADPSYIAEPATGAASARRLLRAWPDPLSGAGSVRWSVKDEGPVTLRVYDAGGRLVRTLLNARRKPGDYQTTWNGRADNGRAVSSGIYFYRLQTATDAAELKVVLTR